MSVRNYIQNARNSASQNYMSWTGDAAPQNGGYRNLNAQQFDVAAPVGSNKRFANGGGNNANGSLTISGVTISSAITNVNYQQFLYQSMQQPFSVGLTYIESVGGTSAQITQTFTLNTQDANGNQLLRTIVPTIDPYQQQSTIVAVKQEYSIDGFTKLTFSSIGASVSFRVHFYPSTNINLSAGLQNAPVAQRFGNPNIVGVPTYIQG